MDMNLTMHISPWAMMAFAFASAAGAAVGVVLFRRRLPDISKQDSTLTFAPKKISEIGVSDNVRRS
jgi:hypothetical protein